jgi:hypothetical protein
VGEDREAPRVLTPEQTRRRRRRSIALAIVLGVLAILFYVMALVEGPGIMNRPL